MLALSRSLEEFYNLNRNVLWVFMFTNPKTVQDLACKFASYKRSVSRVRKTVESTDIGLSNCSGLQYYYH